VSREQVIIVGAGVAGLSLAIMLAEQGIESHVLESRQRFDGPTSGVRISGQGVDVLRSIRVDSIGESTRRIDMHFGRLSAGFSVPVTGDSPIVVTRLALHEQLMRRAELLGIPVVTGFKVASMTESAEGVEATSELDEKVTGTILVGADGVGSTLRELLNPGLASTKTYAGYLGVGLITRDEAKIDMTLHHYPGYQVGIASCGKVSESATGKSIFMWTHFRMPEAEAKLATRASVESELSSRAQQWAPVLRQTYDRYAKDADAILAFGPVYNGQPPHRWYSSRMVLCGDAAHPYGPGGQGITMALKDAQALSDVIGRGFTEDQKMEYQRSRALEARTFGEAAERRNAKPHPSTRWGVLAQGVAVKAMEVFTGGTLKM
jgi:2-polyprenyl-6-methoxyphenol hydroxylase-like FAD-dependent oxidoreductase